MQKIIAIDNIITYIIGGIFVLLVFVMGFMILVKYSSKDNNKLPDPEPDDDSEMDPDEPKPILFMVFSIFCKTGIWIYITHQGYSGLPWQRSAWALLIPLGAIICLVVDRLGNRIYRHPFLLAKLSHEQSERLRHLQETLNSRHYANGQPETTVELSADTKTTDEIYVRKHTTAPVISVSFKAIQDCDQHELEFLAWMAVLGRRHWQTVIDWCSEWLVITATAAIYFYLWTDSGILRWLLLFIVVSVIMLSVAYPLRRIKRKSELEAAQKALTVTGDYDTAIKVLNRCTDSERSVAVKLKRQEV